MFSNIAANCSAVRRTQLDWRKVGIEVRDFVGDQISGSFSRVSASVSDFFPLSDSNMQLARGDALGTI
jgi:hypothetical protein